MPCLAAVLVLLFPRIGILVLYFFTTFFSNIFQSLLWPVLGFLFAPLTLLAYTLLVRINQPQDAIFMIVMIVALVIDLGLARGAGRYRRD